MTSGTLGWEHRGIESNLEMQQRGSYGAGDAVGPAAAWELAANMRLAIRRPSELAVYAAAAMTAMRREHNCRYPHSQDKHVGCSSIRKTVCRSWTWSFISPTCRCRGCSMVVFSRQHVIRQSEMPVTQKRTTQLLSRNSFGNVADSMTSCWNF